MKTQNKTLILLTLLFLNNCAADNSFVTEHKDVWLNDSDRGLVYCRANVKGSDQADPVCFEVGFQRYGDDASLHRIK
jgi:hypothetical protein